MIRHHPEKALLLDYAAGASPEPVALIVAVHLAFCPACRACVAALDAAGGALLDALPGIALADGALDAAFARIDAAVSDKAGEMVGPAPLAPATAALPAPLRSHVPDGFEALPWRRFGQLRFVRLPVGSDRTWQTSLVSMAPGVSGPEHTHRGVEYTLVLRGAFVDGEGRYEAGDFATADPAVRHAPRAEPGSTCIGLAVQNAPVRMTGRVGRMLNPLISVKYGGGRG